MLTRFLLNSKLETVQTWHFREYEYALKRERLNESPYILSKLALRQSAPQK